MAVLHRATLVPTKPELVTALLDRLGRGSGEVEMIGGYRFDDPDGEVGVESLLVRRSGSVWQVPLTYRAAPLAGAEDALVTTMSHSVLGDRWIYRAESDPVGLACFERALAGEQAQAALEVEHPDGTREALELPIVLTLEGEPVASGSVRFTAEDAAPAEGAARLVATWDRGSLVVAARG